MAMNDIVLELRDLRHLDWAERKLSPGTPGCFLKAYEEKYGKRYYYKLSNYDSYRGVFGHESINELIVSRLLSVLGIPHVQYQLIHALIQVDDSEIETWISCSENFRKDNEEKMPLDMYYDLEKEGKESPLEFVIRQGWEEYIYQMILVDYLVANRDRHGSNIEILRNISDNSVRMAPLFDQGVSLLFSTYGDEIQLEKFDVLQDIQANNYIGSRSLEYNLSLVPMLNNIRINKLAESDKEIIFKDIEKALSVKHIEKIWEMIWKRWQYYETLCNKK